MLTDYIPVVNVAPLAVNGNEEPSEGGYLNVGNQLARAFEDIGFAYLKNHGIPENLITEAHEASFSFFNLPSETKEKYSKVSYRDEKENHGYVAIDREKLASGAAPNEIRESYDVNYLDGKFPDEECPALKPKVTELLRNALQLSFRLLKSLEFAIGLEPGTLLQHHCQHLSETGSLMRILYYPPISPNVKDGTVRCGTHSDYGTLTLLFQDSIGGLEVLNRSGEWQLANPVPETILVNVGDLLQIWTGDRFISTKHRVLVPKEEVKKRCSRSSIVLFYHPLDEVLVKPLDGSAKYEPITAGQYLLKKYKSTYEY